MTTLRTGHVYTFSSRIMGYDDITALATERKSQPLAGEAGVQVYVLSRRPYVDWIYQASDLKIEHLGKPAMHTSVGGALVTVWDGYLYTGCTRHTPTQANKLVARVAKALGWEIER